jgi:phosphonate dehydrogenase
MMKPKAVVTNRIHDEVLDHLSRHCTVIANSDRERPFTRQDILAAGADTQAILAFMPDCIDAALLAELPALRIVACALKGYDNFDVDACSRRGVWLSIVPDLLTEPTAELTIGLMIALARRVLESDRFVRTGQFADWRPRFYGTGLAGSTITIVGMGAVGRAVAQRLAGFGAAVRYVDRQPLSGEEESALSVRRATLNEALPESDFVVLTLPLTAETIGLFDAGTIGRMKAGSFHINPGRVSLVDEEAVADALAAGRLAGYAADVFETEDWARPDRPAGVAQRLLDDARRTCLTPHIGSAVTAVRREIEMAAAWSIVQALTGRHPEGAVNDAEPARQAAGPRTGSRC